MSAKTNYQSQYKSLKAQYDALLDKNQNDLIKIKQKEKQLSEQLTKITQDRDGHIEKIEELRKELEGEREKRQGELKVNVIDKQETKVAELEMDVRKLMDQNIALTAENTSLTTDANQLRRENEDLMMEIDRMKESITSLQTELNGIKSKHSSKTLINTSSQTEKKIISQEDITIAKQQLQRLQADLQQMALINSDLKQKLKTSEEQMRILSDRQRKSVNLLKKKDLELMQIQEEAEKLRMIGKQKKRKTESEEGACAKCKQHEQEILLLKQMVRSTKGMVRVREIEVEKYKMLNEDSLVKDNKSTGKISEKIGSLPPLKKKNPE